MGKNFTLDKRSKHFFGGINAKSIQFFKGKYTKVSNKRTKSFKKKEGQMLKTCYKPKFNHEKSMWTLKIVRETNGKQWEQLAHFESFESAMEYRLMLIRMQYQGGLLAHEQQFKVR